MNAAEQMQVILKSKLLGRRQETQRMADGGWRMAQGLARPESQFIVFTSFIRGVDSRNMMDY